MNCKIEEVRNSQKQGVCCLDRLSDVKKNTHYKITQEFYIRNHRQEVGIMVLKNNSQSACSYQAGARGFSLFFTNVCLELFKRKCGYLSNLDIASSALSNIRLPFLMCSHPMSLCNEFFKSQAVTLPVNEGSSGTLK